jgi:hypothetical protein
MNKFPLRFPACPADRPIPDLRLAGEQLRNDLQEWRAQFDLDRLGNALDGIQLLV